LKALTKLVLIFLLYSSCNHKDSTKIENSILNKDFHTFDDSKKIYFLDSVSNLLQTRKYDTILIDKYFEASTEYYYLNEFEKSKKMALFSVSLSRVVNDSARIAKSYYYLGDSYENTYKDSAYYYYNIAEKTYRLLKEKTSESHMIYNKAYLLFYNGNYIECELLLTKALKKLEKTDDYELIFTCYTLLGNTLEKQSKIDEAIVYNNLAKTMLQKMENSKIEKSIINDNYIAAIINECNLNNKRGQYEKSIKLLKTILTDKLKKENKRFYSIVLGNFAYSLMKSGNTQDVERMLLESLELSKKHGNDSDIIAKETNLAEYYLFIKDSIRSKEYLSSVYLKAKKGGCFNDILYSLKTLSLIDKNNNKYLIEYYKVADSLKVVQSKNFDKYARIEYETTKIKDSNIKLSQKIVYVVFISIFVILILIILIILRYIKTKKSEYLLIKERNLANEELFKLLNSQQEKVNTITKNEKNRIARELHDGVMNKIYGIRMNLGFFNQKTDVETINKREFYINELQKVESEIRIISHDLNNASLMDELNFITMIKNIIENQENTSDINFVLSNDMRIDWDKIDNLYKINIYRIIQEIIFNVVKYSEAKTCSISFQIKSENQIELSIIDDGVGFDLKTYKKGIGIKNILQRVKSLKSVITIDTEMNKGTKTEIQFHFPNNLI
jgi:signal transduction histidine kinase